jgi:hypothetical protein
MGKEGKELHARFVKLCPSCVVLKLCALDCACYEMCCSLHCCSLGGLLFSSLSSITGRCMHGDKCRFDHERPKTLPATSAASTATVTAAAAPLSKGLIVLRKNAPDLPLWVSRCSLYFIFVY